MTGPEPTQPYAIYLAAAGRFHLLAFDLDAGKASPAVVLEDLAQLRTWLIAAGIPHLVAASGPGGGRHVWAAIAGTGADAARVRRLARSLAARLPTLDIAPLTNPATGCVRPPGAPHRAQGWRSRIENGTWEVLLQPTATAASVELLLDIVGPPPLPPARRSGTVSVAVDPTGHRYITGPRRALPARSRAALELPLPSGADASVTLWTVLLGAARAHQRFADVAALLATAPGLEHARTSKPASGPGRVTRPHGQALQVLERQWARAVETVATSPAETGDGADEEFAARLQLVIDEVVQLQTRADACPARWWRPGGPADRRVLDHICLMALAGVRTDLDLDIRSVALSTGIGRETARTALHRLALDTWLTQLTPAAGPQAATWALPQRSPAPVLQEDITARQRRSEIPGEGRKEPESGLSTEDLPLPRSHVVPRPPGGAGSQEIPSRTLARLSSARTAWSSRLRHRISAQAHDVFVGTVEGLGHHAGALYAILETSPDVSKNWVDLGVLIERTGGSESHLKTLLAALAAYRLARPGPASPDGRGPAWTARSRRHRPAAARQLGVDGVLAARMRRAAVDRQVWAWWLAELEWMHTPARDRSEHKNHGRRPGPGQQTLPLPGATTARHQHGPYPRHRGHASGRADHTAARAALQTAHAA